MEIQKNKKRKIVVVSALVFLFLIGFISIFFYLRYRATHITTDDAFIEGRIYRISPKISGTVMSVHVEDNQFVKKGDLLVEIERDDFDVEVKKAMAGLEAERKRLLELNYNLESSRKKLEELMAALRAAKANLELQEANMRQTKIDLERAEGLLREEVIPREKYDRAKTAYDIAVAQVKATEEQIKQIEASISTQIVNTKQAEVTVESQKALIKFKEAFLKEAELNRSYTNIYAPSNGYITRKAVEKGNYVHAGQPIMAIVPLDEIWVVANYKETQLERVRPGQRVQIRVDTYPGKVFSGRVESIMAGTGSVFSLFPPENATGTYVKVVQRVPVKIVFDQEPDQKYILRIGMSVIPTIIIED